MAEAVKTKRKRVVLSIEDKLEIIKLIDKSVSYTIICEQYGIGRSTVGDIKKNRAKIISFKKNLVEMGCTSKKAKVMKLSTNDELDKAVYVWFKQKRMEGVPVSGPMLCEKAVQLNLLLGGESTFVASPGWKWRFCRRHGIRNLSIHGEKLSSDKKAADEFVSSFSKFVKDQNFSLDQVFNCDETGLYFRLLPEQTLAASFEKSAEGRKKSKDRVTINACSNASGTIKLPLHLIGKAKRPRCFKGVNMNLLRVKYSGQKNAWMDSGLFHEWFHDCFVPYVREKLESLGLEKRAVLVLDNCSAHPSAEDLVSDDGKIFVKYLPANVTALIQPMDQGVLKSLKLRYKKKLLRRLLIEDDMGGSIVDFLKGVNMNTVANLVAEAWDEIKPSTLRKSWRKILPLESPKRSVPQTSSDSVTELLEELFTMCMEDNSSDDLTDLDQPLTRSQPSAGSSYAIWRGIKVRPSHNTNPQHTPDELDPGCVSDFQSIFEGLGYDLHLDDVSTWLESDWDMSGNQIFTDSEICELASHESSPPEAEDEDEEEMDSEEIKCLVSHSRAAFMFEQCLSWLEHQPEATIYNTALLRELHSLAAVKREDCFKQTNITKYFQKN